MLNIVQFNQLLYNQNRDLNRNCLPITGIHLELAINWTTMSESRFKSDGPIQFVSPNHPGLLNTTIHQ